MPDALGRTLSEPVQQASAAAAADVLMVRPARFGFNAETGASNAFQQRDASLERTAAGRAREEFDGLVQALREAGIAVHALEDSPQPPCPDAVFPNNWVSFHPDGTVVLYPMLAPSRRRERRMDLLTQLVAQGSFDVRRLLDLTGYEARGEYLEGTGSLVLDHAARVAYACLSPRTDEAPLGEFCAELGFEPCVFRAQDPAGRPVYHTNVVLSVGPSVAVVAAQAIVAADRERVLARLACAGRTLLTIDSDQAAAFAANVLELRGANGRSVLAMSDSAARAFGAGGLGRIRNAVDIVVAAPVPTIETLGGGSVRCMIAEVFLPKGCRP